MRGLQRKPLAEFDPRAGDGVTYVSRDGTPYKVHKVGGGGAADSFFRSAAVKSFAVVGAFTVGIVLAAKYLFGVPVGVEGIVMPLLAGTVAALTARPSS